MDAKLNTRNIVIRGSLSSGRDFTAYINQPSKEESLQIAKILGFIYTQASKDEIDISVLAMDWKVYVDDYIQNARNPQELTDTLNAFFERRIDSSTIFYDDTGETVTEKIEEDIDALNAIKGYLLFFSAVLRFASQAIAKSAMKDYYTSLSASEFQELLKRRSKEAKAIADKRRLQKQS